MFIKEAYLIDRRSKTGRALTKLSDKHIKPNNCEKMSVPIAAELLIGQEPAILKAP